MHTYGDEFSTSSAQEVLPVIFDAIGTPNSVIDVGCGIGTWLSVCNDLGVKNIIGLDGQHVLTTGQLLISDVNFMPVDFERIDEINLNYKFEFLISLEVAEHIHEKSADKFIELLTSLSDIILFSAAIPGQTGMNHFNEQYPEYWREKFTRHGFEFFDIRTGFWDNSNIEWWYRQNMFLVANSAVAANIEKSFEKWGGDLFIAKELLELYTKSLNSVNTDNLTNPMIARTVHLFPRYVLNRLLDSLRNVNHRSHSDDK
jgi:hypothetical protein